MGGRKGKGEGKGKGRGREGERETDFEDFEVWTAHGGWGVDGCFGVGMDVVGRGSYG